MTFWHSIAPIIRVRLFDLLVETFQLLSKDYFLKNDETH